MVSLTYDLHIHSCLSPCADDDMTPANIIGMAALKGLDVIAVTDHNSCRNCPAVVAAAKEYGVVVVPGMELCTVEEVHVICLFGELEQAMKFDTYVYQHLLKVRNQEEIFGRQQLYGKDDHICGTEPFLLINSVNLPFSSLWQLVRSYEGVLFPAHIDKTTNSLLSNLGFISPDSQFRAAEIKELKKLKGLREQHSYLQQCLILRNSDAHYLEEIQEPEQALLVEEVSAAGVVASILQGQ